MKRLSTLALTTMSLLLLGGCAGLAGDVIAQQTSLKGAARWNVDLRLKHQYPGGWQPKTDRPI